MASAREMALNSSGARAIEFWIGKLVPCYIRLDLTPLLIIGEELNRRSKGKILIRKKREKAHHNIGLEILGGESGVCLMLPFPWGEKKKKAAGI